MLNRSISFVARPKPEVFFVAKLACEFLCGDGRDEISSSFNGINKTERAELEGYQNRENIQGNSRIGNSNMPQPLAARRGPSLRVTCVKSRPKEKKAHPTSRIQSRWCRGELVLGGLGTSETRDCPGVLDQDHPGRRDTLNNTRQFSIHNLVKPSKCQKVQRSVCIALSQTGDITCFCHGRESGGLAN